jgi:hypothetical protein
LVGIAFGHRGRRGADGNGKDDCEDRPRWCTKSEKIHQSKDTKRPRQKSVQQDNAKANWRPTALLIFEPFRTAEMSASRISVGVGRVENRKQIAAKLRWPKME